MSVVVEFSVPADGFALAPALSADEDVRIALEAIVPTSDERFPYVWVSGEDPDRFERAARNEANVAGVTRLDRVGEDALYRIDWAPDADGLLAGLADHEAVVLEATRRRRWRFRVRFHDHDRLPGFYAFCRERDLGLSVARVAVLEERSPSGPAAALTPEQREALVLAVREGYFEVPGRADLSSIAEELGITQQATSNRIRRGVDRVLRSALRSPAGGSNP